MNKLSHEKRVAVVSALVEGCSIASTCRMTGVAKMTALKLLADVGEACADLQDRWMRDLPLTHIQVDEIWSFVGMKAKHVPAECTTTRRATPRGEQEAGRHLYPAGVTIAPGYVP